MSFWVIMFEGGVMLAYNRAERSWPYQNDGWEPYVWTFNLFHAAKFLTEAEAEMYGITHLRHANWRAVEMVPITVPQGEPA